MPWRNDPESRRKSNATYGAAWRRARDAALQRANWRCEARLDGCAGAAAEVDHVDQAANDPNHRNLRAVCRPCHRKITAQQGKGYRRGNRGPAKDPDVEPRTRW